ncbi:hypothetical protein Tco_0963148 [Tanacetum coccineum]
MTISPPMTRASIYLPSSHSRYIKLRVDADLVVIASMDVPAHWIHTLFAPQLQESAGGLPKTKLVSHSCSLAGSTSAMEVSILIAFVLMKVSNWGGHLHFREVGESDSAWSEYAYDKTDLTTQRDYISPAETLQWDVKPSGTGWSSIYRVASLPLGIQCHESNYATSKHYLRYDSEMPFVLIQSILYLGIIAVTRLARPSLTKLCYRGAEKTTTTIQTILKAIAIFSIFVSYTLPFLLVPHTIHPILGWTLYLLGSFALSSIATNAFLLSMLPVLTLWVGIVGALIVMAYPWYNDGVVRALSIFAYAFFVAPILWISMAKIGSSLHISLEREVFLPSRITELTQPISFNKLY